MTSLIRTTLGSSWVQHVIALVAGLAPLLAGVTAEMSAALRHGFDVRLWRAELRALRLEERGRAPERRVAEAEYLPPVRAARRSRARPGPRGEA